MPLWAIQLLPQLLMEHLILCRYNVDTLNICMMEEFIIFVCTDYTEIFFSKLRSVGLNYNLPSFFTESYCAGGGGDLKSIAYWLFHSILNLLNSPKARLINFIWNDHSCKILYVCDNVMAWRYGYALDKILNFCFCFLFCELKLFHDSSYIQRQT